MVSHSPKDAEEPPAEQTAAESAHPEQAPGEGTSSGSERVRRIEQALVRCEGQLQGLQQRVADLEAALRLGRKRALYFRLGLLVLLLTAYMLVRSRYVM